MSAGVNISIIKNNYKKPKLKRKLKMLLWNLTEIKVQVEVLKLLKLKIENIKKKALKWQLKT